MSEGKKRKEKKRENRARKIHCTSQPFCFFAANQRLLKSLSYLFLRRPQKRVLLSFEQKKSPHPIPAFLFVSSSLQSPQGIPSSFSSSFPILITRDPERFSSNLYVATGKRTTFNAFFSKKYRIIPWTDLEQYAFYRHQIIYALGEFPRRFLHIRAAVATWEVCRRKDWDLQIFPLPYILVARDFAVVNCNLKNSFYLFPFPLPDFLSENLPLPKTQKRRKLPKISPSLPL